MGHSTDSMTGRFRSERSFFKGFQRALLLKSDQLLFDELWNEVEAYIPPAEKSDHPLLIATVLMAMLLEQKKSLLALQTRLEKLQAETGASRHSQEARLAQLQSELQRLDDGMDARLRTLRSEITEMVYPLDAAS